MAIIASKKTGTQPSSLPDGGVQGLLFRHRAAVAAAALLAWLCVASLWFGGGANGGGGTASATLPASSSSSSLSPPAALPASSASSVSPSPLNEWRRAVHAKCASASTAEEVAEVGQAARSRFRVPDATEVEAMAAAAPQDGGEAVVRCKRTVLDFGANVGDTMAHMMDAGLVSCEKKGVRPSSFPHFDQAAFVLTDKGWNRITKFLVGMMESLGTEHGPPPPDNGAVDKRAAATATTYAHGPEHYCYYGIEGNPVFTDRLRRAQLWANAIDPRPLQRAHFFTETVGAGSDGPTQLFLDTVNEKQNFWGSSIYSSHQDVRKSADANAKASNTLRAANVTGVTISTLMKQTLLPFDPHASDADKAGGHLLLKVDIEGGEYPLLEEAVRSGVLCDFVRMGNRADLLIEFHSARVTGVAGQGPKARKHREALEKCGVVFRTLQAWWA